MRISVYGSLDKIDALIETVLVKKDYQEHYAEIVKETIDVFKKIITNDGDTKHQSFIGYFKQMIVDKEKYPTVINLLLQDIISVVTDETYVPDLGKYSFIEEGEYPYKTFVPLNLKVNYKDYNPVLIDELETILRKYGIQGLVLLLKYFKIISNMRKHSA